jgi:hypothetical protein
MRFFSRSVVLSVIAVCATVAVASAAAPKPGGTYQGMSASHHSVRIKIARSGKTGELSYCGFKVGFHVSGDHFGVRKTTAGGAVTEFRIRGSWKTSRLVQGYIDLDFGCDGRPGPWSATLK